MRVVSGVVGVVVGALCLVLAFRGVASTQADTGVAFDAIWSRIASVPWWSRAAFVVLMLAQFFLRTQRWRIQTRGLTGSVPSMRDSAAINAAAFAAVFFLPFRLGEFVRPNLCAQRNIMSRSEGLAATVLERVMDGIITTGFFGVVLLLMRDMSVPGYVRAAGLTALLIFGGALVFFVMAFRFRKQTLSVVDAILSRVHLRLSRAVTSMVGGFLDGLACFARPRDVLAYIALTCAYWLINAVSMYALMVGMQLAVSPVAACFCLCFLVIGVMIPAPPGNVGNFHAFARAALTVFGVAQVPSIAYAILLHAATAITVLLWALLFVLTGDVSFARLKAAAVRGTAAAVDDGTR